jgi:hypothetical protein
MGREIPTPSGTVSDLLQPRAQVIRVPRAMSTRDGLVGQHATARWDLSLRLFVINSRLSFSGLLYQVGVA